MLTMQSNDNNLNKERIILPIVAPPPIFPIISQNPMFCIPATNFNLPQQQHQQQQPFHVNIPLSTSIKLSTNTLEQQESSYLFTPQTVIQQQQQQKFLEICQQQQQLRQQLQQQQQQLCILYFEV